MKKETDFKEKIILFADGRLSAEEERAFKKEIDSSADLRKQYEEYLNLLEDIRSQKNLEVDERYFNGIVPKFREKLPAGGRSARYIPKLAIAGALVAVIMISIFNMNGLKSPAVPSLQSITSQLKSDELNQMLNYYTEGSGYSDITGYNPVQSDSVISTMLTQELNLTTSDLDYVANYNSGYDYSNLIKNANKADIELVYNQLINEKF